MTPAVGDRVVRIVLVLCIAIVIIFNLSIITWGMPGAHRSVSSDADEMTIFDCFRRMNPATLDFDPNYYDYPHFHYYMIGAAVYGGARLGFYRLVPDEKFYFDHPHEWHRIFLAVRLIQIILSVALIPAVHHLGAMLFDRRIALIPTVLMTLSAARLDTTLIIGNELPLTLWIVVLLIGLLKYVRGEGRSCLVLAAAAHILAMGSHPVGFFLYPVVGVGIVLRRSDAPPLARFKELIVYLVATFLLFTLCNPFYFRGLFGVHEIGSGMAGTFGNLLRAQQKASGLMDDFMTFAGGVRMIGRALSYSFGNLSLAVLAAGALVLGFKRDRATLCVTLALTLPYLAVAALAGERMVTEDRIFPIYALILLPVGHLLQTLKNAGRTAASLALIAILIFESATMFTLRWQVRATLPNLRAVASEWLLERIGTKHVIGTLHWPFVGDADIIYMEYWHPRGRLRLATLAEERDLETQPPPEFIQVSRHDLLNRYPFLPRHLAYLREHYAPYKNFHQSIRLFGY